MLTMLLIHQGVVLFRKWVQLRKLVVTCVKYFQEMFLGQIL